MLSLSFFFLYGKPFRSIFSGLQLFYIAGVENYSGCTCRPG
nr:MAG TPA: hypothetical protein [Caudoviricetes sp.]